MSIYGCLWVPIGVYGFLGIYGCHGCLWVLYFLHYKYCLFSHSRTLEDLRNLRKFLKSHMCYKKQCMPHGGEGLYQLACFQYSPIKTFFSLLVHNILLILSLPVG